MDNDELMAMWQYDPHAATRWTKVEPDLPIDHKTLEALLLTTGYRHGRVMNATHLIYEPIEHSGPVILFSYEGWKLQSNTTVHAAGPTLIVDPILLEPQLKGA